MTSQTGPQLPIDLDYPGADVNLDIDALLIRGRARVRRRRVAVTGVVGIAVLLVGLAATTLGHGPPRHRLPATTAIATVTNLMTAHPPQGHVEVLRTGAGWHPVVYRDRGGLLCEGWRDPVNHGVTGACLDATAGKSAGKTAEVTRPLLVEPQAGVAKGSVEAFGIAGPATHSLDLAISGRNHSVQLSTVRSRQGDRAWLTGFSMHRSRHRTVHLVAHDRRGRIIATVGFRPPAAGSASPPTSPASEQPSPSAPVVSGTPTPSNDSTPQPTPTQTPDSPAPTSTESPVVTDSPLAATTP